MNKNRPALLALCLGCFFLVAGCRTSKIPPAADTETASRLETEERFFHALREQAFRYETLSARMQIELTMPAGKTFSSRASLKIRKNDRLQLSLQPLLGIEAFRMDLSPDSIWIVDRLNKRYLAENFSRLIDTFRIEFNFYSLQALFTNQLFFPGKTELPENAFTRFRWLPAADGYTLQTQDVSRRQYSFTAGRDRKLYASQIVDTASGHALHWDYTDFRPVGAQLFPMKIQAGWIDGEQTKGALSMNYLHIDTNVPVEIRPVIPSGYERVNLSQIRRMIEQP
ncbi:MAG: DUF4292 domain-containing protein [Tannerella sp.]|jgi:hypothetical protein|nr:DUF4292 domain-containing protein [Tannerella sp.]